MKERFARFFDFRGRQTGFRRETVAGLVTFMTMAYILFVNAGLLAQGGMDFQAALDNFSD